MVSNPVLHESGLLFVIGLPCQTEKNRIQNLSQKKSLIGKWMIDSYFVAL